MQKTKWILFLCVAVLGCKNATEPNTHVGNWILNYSAQDGYFHGLSFPDKNHGWVVGDSGSILRTSNAGNSWEVQESGIGSSLKCVYFANASKGWIGGGENSIGMTTNGGGSWSWQHPAGEPNRTFMGISFVDDSTGWIVDNYGGILHTENGGISWTPQTSGTTWAITSVQFLDANEGWATATNRLVLHTTNGGDEWSIIALDSLDYGTTVVFNDIYFLNRSKAWIATIAGLNVEPHPAPIVASSDTGNTWSCQTTPEEMFITSVVFLNESLGWATASAGILNTTDGGVHWTYQLSLPSALFVDLSLVDQSVCWALTFTGKIYRFEIS